MFYNRPLALWHFLYPSEAFSLSVTKPCNRINMPIAKLNYQESWSELHFLAAFTFVQKEPPWPSYNALDSDQHGPGFEAQRRPLVMSGRASGPKCLCQNYSSLRGTLQAPRNWGKWR